MTEVFPRAWIRAVLGATIAPAAGANVQAGILHGAGFTAILTDSRKAAPGVLFVALKGDKFDGHDFIEAALGAGADGIVCRADFAPLKELQRRYPGAEFYPVEDPLVAYRTLAAKWRSRFRFPLVAVAGSVGKTTTKDLLASILGGKFRNVLKTQGSQNGFVGIPMTLLELREGNDAAVVEVGIDDVGTMRGHMDVVAPTAALLTAIGPEHLEKLKDVATVAREEAEALEWVGLNSGSDGAPGIALIRMDDSSIAPLAERLSRTKARSVRFGIGLEGVDVRGEISDGEKDAAETLFVTTKNGWRDERFVLPLKGAHNASNLLAAVAAAWSLGLTADEIRVGLASFKGATGRTEIRRLKSGATVICDHYNANPASMAAALKLLSGMRPESNTETPTEVRGKTWACFADMLELGPSQERFHRELASPIVESGVDVVYLFGPRMKWLEDELKKRGFAGALRHFESHAEMAAEIAAWLEPADILLLKGSRGMRMEEVLNLL